MNIELVCPQCQTVNRVTPERLGDRPRCGHCRQLLLPGRPLELDGAKLERLLQREGLPLLVDFWAPWCGPCKNFAPVFADAARRWEPHLRLAKLDTEAEPLVAERFGIRSIPTLMLFRHGQEYARQSGALNRDQLDDWLMRQLRTAASA